MEKEGRKEGTPKCRETGRIEGGGREMFSSSFLPEESKENNQKKERTNFGAKNLNASERTQDWCAKLGGYNKYCPYIYHNIKCKIVHIY